MTTFNSFEEMEVWKKSRQLVKKIRAICKRKKVAKDFAFIDQISRAVRSIPANIAEGFESMTMPEFIGFLGYSKRSAGEVRSHLYDALDESYVDKSEFNELIEETKIICRMLAKLIHHLQSQDKRKKRTHAKPN